MKTENLARHATRIFPVTEFSDRATIKANRRNWIAARRSMRATLLEDAEFSMLPRVLGAERAPLSAVIVNTYERHKDTMVLVVTVVTALPVLLLDILAISGV